jgi:hypothetical protein
MYNEKSFMNGIARKLTDFLGSRRCWYIILGFFVFEALWFVFSAVYPMAFDEDFHLGVIRIYATHWSPFLTEHPPGADQFGAVVRDPSYLYHYLMSFPYRLLTHFTSSEATQVIWLRLINVALFAYGLVLFRKVMLRARASRAFVHVALALFILIPIVPQLAAHINYDNLLMVLLPLLCLQVFSLVDGLRQRHIRANALLGFITTCLTICVVKYAALPFLVAAVLFVVTIFIKYFRHHFDELWSAFRHGFRAWRRPLTLGLIALCVVTGVLFAQRYIVNMVNYKTPVPDCGQVLSVNQCTAYGPWGRDYYFEQTKPSDFSANPFNYMYQWLQGMWYRLFFAVNGPASVYTNYPPLPIPSHAAIGLLIFGLAAVAFSWKRIFRGNVYLIFFALLIIVYCAILWFDQYGMYKQTAQPVAINGRYLLPVLPLFAVILGRGISLLLRRINFKQAKAVLAVLALCLFLQGGGLLTFILRSDSSWYWPSSSVQKVNQKAQKVLSPVIIEGSKYY